LSLPTGSATATVAKKVSGVITSLGTFTIPGTGTRSVRFQVQGTSIRAWVWQSNQPEPTVWNIDVVSTAVAATGKNAVTLTRTAGTNSVAVDNWVLKNPTIAPVATATYTWNNDNQPTGETLVGGSRAWTYTTGRVTNYSQTLAATTTATGLTYDTSGRVKTEVTGAFTKTYGYDTADQLVTVTPSTGSVTTYAYDLLGRRTSVKVGATTTTNTFNAASQLMSVGTTTFTYDNAGRRVTETAGATVTTHAYDPQGRLASTTRGATVVSRGYDPDDNLVSVTNGATVTGIDWDPTSGIAQPTRIGPNRLVSGPDGWLQSRTGLVDTNLGRDIYGSPITPAASVRSTGYDAYGKPAAGVNTWTPVLGYRGEITIDSLTYLRARNYDAANGVFTTRDPIDGVNGTTVVGNAYHYGNNNPIMNTDPTGMSTRINGDSLYHIVRLELLLLQGFDRYDDDLTLVGNWMSSSEGGDYWNPFGTDICFGGTGCLEAWKHWQRGGETPKALAEAKIIATYYCVNNFNECVNDKYNEEMVTAGVNAVLGVAAIGASALAARAAAAAEAEAAAAAEAAFVNPAAAGNVSPWALPPSPRGFVIEDALGGNLPKNFPTIDIYANGTATSIKSIDLTAPSYQSASRLTSRLNGYVRDVASFEGATFSGTRISSGSTTSRELVIAVPEGVATEVQQAALIDIVQYGASKGVTVRVVSLP
jgi:RHS repeat-associated protein